MRLLSTNGSDVPAGWTGALARRGRTAGKAVLVLALLAAAVGVGGAWVLDGDPAATPRAVTSQVAVERAYGRLPMRFEANHGQTDPRVRFLSRGAGYSLFLTPREAVLALTRETGGGKPGASTTAVVRMGLVGANPRPEMVGGQQLGGVTNYLRGKDPSRWQKGVPGFGQVRYQQVYPGVDLIFHGRQRRLEYDFAVAPGRDPGVIGVRFAGARRIELERGTGDLLLHTGAGTLRQHAPVAYQLVGGKRRAVSSRYVRRGAKGVGFSVGAYDRSRPLVIDPVLSYSTYLSGTSGITQNAAITIDQAGNAYIAGSTGVFDYPTTAGVLQPAKMGLQGDLDGFVTKLAPSGSALVYSTFLGGNDLDRLYSVAIDGSGRAFVSGVTFSTNFPSTANAFSQTSAETYLSMLNAQGTALVYSTFLPWGDLGGDGLPTVAVDSAGKAYVTGNTNSDALPVRAPAGTTPFQATRGGGDDAYVARFDPALSGDASLVYASYLGGSGSETPQAIALDAASNIYVAGSTGSANFPTQNAFQSSLAGNDDLFVSKLNPQGSALSYSTYLGGERAEGNRGGFNGLSAGQSSFVSVGLAVDASGGAYVGSQTLSDDFPTKNAFQPAKAADLVGAAFCSSSPCQDGVVAKFDTVATGAASLVYSSYLGGNSGDWVRGAGVDGTGHLYVAGYTRSTDFPVVDPIAPKGAVERAPGPGFQYGDAFVARVRPDGGLALSSYFGGGGGDGVTGVSVDAAGAAYFAGNTFSAELPTRGAVQDVNRGRAASDGQSLQAFAFKLAPTDPQAPVVSGLSPRSATKEGGTTVTISGRRLAGATAVSFGGVAAESFRVDSDSQITAVAPARAVGPAAVVVAADGRSTAPGNPIADLAYGEGSLAVAASRVRERGNVVAMRLADGRVLAVGGVSAAGNPFLSGSVSAAAEIYDPATGAWTATGSMRAARCRPTLTLLADGRVLAAGGGTGCPLNNLGGPSGGLASAELYDPVSGTWSLTGSLATGRVRHTATVLGDGRVLVVGSMGPTAVAEIYNPMTGAWTATGSTTSARGAHGAARLGGPACVAGMPPSYCGKVLVAGGRSGNNDPTRSAELYDPVAGTWQATGDMFTGRGEFTAVNLPDGSVLAAAGCSFCPFSATPNAAARSAEVYVPALGGWVEVPAMSVRRRDYGAALGADGKVLIVGGNATDSRLASAEVYDPGSGPAAGRFVPRLPLTRHRQFPFVVPLVDGRVLIGGDSVQADATSELYTTGRPAVVPNLQATPSPGPGPGPGPVPEPQGDGGSGGGGGSQGAGPAADVTPPAVTGVRVADEVFSIGSLLPRLASAARVGTTIRFTLSEAARAQLSFARVLPGRRVGRSCRRPTRALRARPRCTRFVTVSPSVVIAGARAGANSVRFQGRLSRTRRLSPGRYRLTVTATDAAGNRSAPRTARFRLTRR